MSDSASTSGKGGFDQTALNALRLGGLFLIVYWCFKIVAPFIPLVLWGVIIAVAVYPLHRSLAERLGNRIKLSATLVALLGLLVLTTPVVVLTESLVESSMGLRGQCRVLRHVANHWPTIQLRQRCRRRGQCLFHFSHRGRYPSSGGCR